MTATKEVDSFGNVTYAVRDGARLVGRIYKMSSSSYRVERASDEAWAPVGSIKRGIAWLAEFAA